MKKKTWANVIKTYRQIRICKKNSEVFHEIILQSSIYFLDYYPTSFKPM